MLFPRTDKRTVQWTVRRSVGRRRKPQAKGFSAQPDDWAWTAPAARWAGAVHAAFATWTVLLTTVAAPGSRAPGLDGRGESG